MSILKYLLSTFIPSKDDGSYIQLDEEMRKRLKLAAAILILTCSLIALASIYFYFQWSPLVNLFDKLTGNVIEEITTSKSYPQWFKDSSIFMIVILLAITSIFFYQLIDIGKVHYKIDKITFKIIPELNLSQYEKIKSFLNCYSNNCIFSLKIRKVKYQNLFRNQFYYNFTNRDKIGEYNQKDTRRNVFKQWSKYYVFNLTSIIFLFIYLWGGFLFLVISSSYLQIKLLSYITLFLIAVYAYKNKGEKYKAELIELANHQLDMIFLYLPDDAFLVLKNIFGNCENENCKLNGEKT